MTPALGYTASGVFPLLKPLPTFSLSLLPLPPLPPLPLSATCHTLYFPSVCPVSNTVSASDLDSVAVVVVVVVVVTSCSVRMPLQPRIRRVHWTSTPPYKSLLDAAPLPLLLLLLPELVFDADADTHTARGLQFQTRTSPPAHADATVA
jgi:hypothetical protein